RPGTRKRRRRRAGAGAPTTDHGLRTTDQGLVDPRLPLGTGAQAVGFGVADELFLDRVVFQVALEPHADIGAVDGAHGMVHDVRVGHGLLPRLDAVEEVAGVIHRAAGALDVVGQELVAVGEQAVGGHLGLLVAIGRGDPAFAAFEPHAAGPV